MVMNTYIANKTNTYCIQNKSNELRNVKKKFKTSDFVVFDTIAHRIINKYYEWCYIVICFIKHPYF